MHLLPGLRRKRPQRRLPQLRRQSGDASDSDRGQTRQGSGLDDPQAQARRLYGRRSVTNTEMSDDVRAIQKLIERWMKASQAGDTASILNMMADDVVFMTCDREPFGK